MADNIGSYQRRTLFVVVVQDKSASSRSQTIRAERERETLPWGAFCCGFPTRCDNRVRAFTGSVSRVGPTLSGSTGRDCRARR